MNIQPRNVILPLMVCCGFALLRISFLARASLPVTGVQTQQDQPHSATAARQNSSALNPAYPAAIQQWEEIIQVAAESTGLESNLIAAVMLQESGGNAQAYSTSGAVGLMQVMPRDGIAATFTCSGQPCFSSRLSMQELWEPVFNVHYGARLLANLIARSGSLRDGLRAYGPMDMGYDYADRVLAIYERHQ